jgi:hypothetical protein
MRLYHEPRDPPEPPEGWYLSYDREHGVDARRRHVEAGAGDDDACDRVSLRELHGPAGAQ